MSLVHLSDERDTIVCEPHGAVEWVRAANKDKMTCNNCRTIDGLRERLARAEELLRKFGGCTFCHGRSTGVDLHCAACKGVGLAPEVSAFLTEGNQP